MNVVMSESVCQPGGRCGQEFQPAEVNREGVDPRLGQAVVHKSYRRRVLCRSSGGTAVLSVSSRVSPSVVSVCM